MLAPFLCDMGEALSKSAVRDAEGRLQTVFHGTVHDFDRFDAGRLGRESRNPSARLGFYFSSCPEEAAAFALGTDGRGRLQAVGARLLPVYLAVCRPYQMAAEEFADLTNRAAISWAQVAELRERLIAEGWDGVVIRADPESDLEELQAADTWVAFFEEQIVSVFSRPPRSLGEARI